MKPVQQTSHDIFISYRHLDDKTDDGQEAGWVTTLKRLLKNELDMKVGKEDYAISGWTVASQSDRCLSEEIRCGGHQ